MTAVAGAKRASLEPAGDGLGGGRFEALIRTCLRLAERDRREKAVSPATEEEYARSDAMRSTAVIELK
jgi:hypothetical protein